MKYRSRPRDSIAVYAGNPWAFNGPGYAMANAFHDAIGRRMRFGASTMNTSNKRYVAGEIYGSISIINIPDTHHTDYLVCMGSNPKISRWTLCPHPNDSGDILKKIKSRGRKVVFVNPGKTESSTEETGDTLQIRPATDVYFLAALLHQIHKQSGFDQALLDQYGKNLADLIAFISRYPAERVSGVTGIDAHIIKEMAAEVSAAKSAAFYMARSVNQNRQGALGCLLVEMFNFVTGNLSRKGGSFKPNGVMNVYPP